MPTYTPPDGDNVVLEFREPYVPPAGDVVVLDFEESEGAAILGMFFLLA